MKKHLLLFALSSACSYANADLVAHSAGDYSVGTGRSSPSACMDLNDHYKQVAEERKRAEALAERCASDQSGRQTAIKYISSLGQPLPDALKPYAPMQVADNSGKQPRPSQQDISDIIIESQHGFKAGGGRQIHRKPGAE